MIMTIMNIPLINWIITPFLKLKVYFSSQMTMGTELKLFTLQALATIFLATPKALSNASLFITLSFLLVGIGFQIYAAKQTRKALIHESFLKKRLESNFENRKGRPEDENAEYFRSEIRDCLIAILEQLNFRYSPHHRIRLYLPREINQTREFSIVAYFTDNSDLERTRMGDYPDEGVLANAWRNGICEVSDLSDFKENESLWKDEQKSKGHLISDKSVDEINFKARQYFSVVIRDPEDELKMGVITIESMLPKSINVKQASRIFETQFAWYIGKCLKEFKKYAPEPKFATERGF